MRLGILLLIVSLKISAQTNYKVVEEGNFKGLIDAGGDKVLEAIFDDLGWSNGQKNVINKQLGYSEREKWGLISLDGKRVTPPVYDKIIPLFEGHFLVASKGKFTNRFFYGVINDKGKLVLNQDYFEVSIKGEVLIATVLDGTQFRVGVFNNRMAPLLPVEYKDILVNEQLIIAEHPSGHKDIFLLSGTSLGKQFDEIKEDGDYLITTKNGFDGLISKAGKVIYEPIYKEIKSSKDVTDFPKWEIREKDRSTEISCDSITYLNRDLWLVHLSGISRFHSNDRDIYREPLTFVQEHSGGVVAKSIPAGVWMAFDHFGNSIIESRDSIYFDGKHFIVLNSDKWSVYNRYGESVVEKYFDEVRPMNDRFLAVKKFGFWALLDAVSHTVSDFRYEGIQEVNGTKAIVRYVNKWGVFQQGNDWLIHPDYDSITFTQDHFIGHKSENNFLFNTDGRRLFQTIDQIETKGDFFTLRFEEKLSALNRNGRPIANTEYDEVSNWGNFFELRKNYAQLVDQFGTPILRERDGYSDIVGYSEGRFLVRKNGAYGFVDEKGSLVIANRYDSAMVFNEGLAAVKLRGRWGFIDENEKLVIQPHYSSVGYFQNGICIYKSAGFYGFMDKTGEEFTGADFKSITKSGSTYILQGKNGKFGLANEEGVITLSTSYDHLSQSGEYWLAQINGKWGLLDRAGRTVLSFTFTAIKPEREAILVRLD